MGRDTWQRDKGTWGQVWRDTESRDTRGTRGTRGQVLQSHISPEKRGQVLQASIRPLVDPMSHEAPREVNEFLRVLETCRHPGRHRVPSHAAMGA